MVWLMARQHGEQGQRAGEFVPQATAAGMGRVWVKLVRG
nr:D402 [uncultured bacterium]